MRAALIVLAVLLAAPATALGVIPSGNVLQNAGGESDAGATDASTVDPPASWSTAPDSPFTVVQYDNGTQTGLNGFPTQQTSNGFGGGAKFFAGGPGAATSTAQQTVTIPQLDHAQIDSGQVAADLSAYIGGYDGHNDNAVIDAFFLNGAGGSIGQLTRIGPVTSADRGGVTTLLPRGTSGRVPAGTRSMRVVITTNRTDPSYNDGYVDNVSLALRGATPADNGGGGTVPNPVIFKTANVERVGRGPVFYSPPPGASSGARISQKGRRFFPISQARQIPIGSLLDTRRGRVKLSTAANASGTVQSGQFYKGLFQVLQSRRGRGLTELRTKGSSFRRCRVRARRGSARSAARRRRLSRRTVRRLGANARGRFRTRGRYSAATVRGTVWTVADRCDGTLTKVSRGRVAVRDFRRKRTISVRAGKRYLARAR